MVTQTWQTNINETMIQNKCGQVTLIDALPRNCRKMRSLLLISMQTWGSRILPGVLELCKWMMECALEGEGRKKVGIDTRVWKRFVACKTDGQCVCVTEPCTSSPQSLLSSCKISSWLSLCNPLTCVCVSAAGTRHCQDHCEWMWDQQLEAAQRWRLWSGWGWVDRRGHVSTLGMHWCALLCKSRVCWVYAQYWDSVSTRVRELSVCPGVHVSPASRWCWRQLLVCGSRCHHPACVCAHPF